MSVVQIGDPEWLWMVFGKKCDERAWRMEMLTGDEPDACLVVGGSNVVVVVPLHGNDQPDGLKTDGHGLDPQGGVAYETVHLKFAAKWSKEVNPPLNDIFGPETWTANQVVLGLHLYDDVPAMKSCRT